jgi:hypothetical protein
MLDGSSFTTAIPRGCTSHMAGKKNVAQKPAKTPSRWPRRGLLAVAMAGGAVVFFARSWLASPEIRLLVPEHGAQWIHENRPFDLRAFGPTAEVVFFRKKVKVPPGIESAVLTVRAFRGSSVYWDKQQRFLANKQNDWKTPRVVTLDGLTAGEHALEVFVANTHGPAALLAYCDALDVRTGPGWEASVYGGAWLPALTVDDVRPPASTRTSDTPATALKKILWWVVPVFLVFWGATAWALRQAGAGGWPSWWTASSCRWVVFIAWIVLAANNFLKVPDNVGYDVQGHIDYVNFLLDRHELPDASHGWQMFQAPFFYVLTAVANYVLTSFLPAKTALLWLRWLTLACGIAQVEICFRAGRYVFPKRDDLQTLTVLLGGLLPINVYMSQTLGNEPLCGVLTALILLWGWSVLGEPKIAARTLPQWRLGLIFGLDLLTKISALVMAPIICVVLALVNRGRGRAAAATAFARCFVTATVVCGWYYLRNYVRFGKILVGGWDPVRGILWWQDPGFRTPWQMISFGHSLFQPIHAGIYSLADGFFASLWMDGNLSGIDATMRVPWNMTLLLAAAWPGLVLSAAVAAGMLRAIGCRDSRLRQALQLAAGSLLLFLIAFVLLWLEVPAYSQAKASYTLGLTPAYAVLCVAGLDLLPPNRVMRSAVTAFVHCWCVLIYGTYFVW